MPLFTTKPTDQLFERFMKRQPNFKPDAPEADRIQETLDAEKERKEARPMIYRDERHQHTFEKEAAMRPESISRALLAALYLLTADRNLWNQVRDHISLRRMYVDDIRPYRHSKHSAHGNHGPGAAFHEILYDSLHRLGHPGLWCGAGQPDSIQHRMGVIYMLYHRELVERMQEHSRPAPV